MDERIAALVDKHNSERERLSQSHAIKVKTIRRNSMRETLELSNEHKKLVKVNEKLERQLEQRRSSANDGAGYLPRATTESMKHELEHRSSTNEDAPPRATTELKHDLGHRSSTTVGAGHPPRATTELKNRSSPNVGPGYPSHAMAALKRELTEVSAPRRAPRQTCVYSRSVTRVGVVISRAAQQGDLGVAKRAAHDKERAQRT